MGFEMWLTAHAQNLPTVRIPRTGGLSLLRGTPMPATLPEVQLAEAVSLVRRNKHHRDCRCNLYRDLNTEGWCSRDEARWSRTLDGLLDEVLQRAKVRLS